MKCNSLYSKALDKDELKITRSKESKGIQDSTTVVVGTKNELYTLADLADERILKTIDNCKYKIVFQYLY